MRHNKVRKSFLNTNGLKSGSIRTNVRGTSNPLVLRNATVETLALALSETTGSLTPKLISTRNITKANVAVDEAVAKVAGVVEAVGAAVGVTEVVDNQPFPLLFQVTFHQ